MKTALFLIPGFPENYTCLLLKSAKRMTSIPFWHFVSQYINSPCITKLQVQVTVSLESQCEEAETCKPALSSLHYTFLLPAMLPTCITPEQWPLPTRFEIAMTQNSYESSKSQRNYVIRLEQNPVLAAGKSLLRPLRKGKYHGLWKNLQITSILNWEIKGRWGERWGGEARGREGKDRDALHNCSLYHVISSPF